MLKILAICGNGMGSALVLRMGLEPALADLGVQANITCTSAGQAGSMAQFADLIILPTNLLPVVDPPDDIPSVVVTNLINREEVYERVEAVLKEHYPEELGSV